MLVAAMYRVSTEKQLKRDGGESIPLQAEAVREFLASRPGWTLVREYAEEGVSGFRRSAEERDVLQQAMADARRGLFSALIVFKADRLSRNALEYPLVIDRFRRLGCEVWSVADGPGGRLLALDTQMDKFVRFLEGWQAETESQNTSIRVSEAMRQMAREGRWTGGPPPFGYRLNPARRPRSNQPALLIDPVAAQTVRLMVRLCLQEQMGCGRIGATLNEEGIRQPSGAPWNAQRVRRILQNPIIAGLPAYGRTGHGTALRGSASPTPAGANLLDRLLVPRDVSGNPRPVPDLQIVPLDVWLQVISAIQHHQPRGEAGAPSPNGAPPQGRSPLRPARGLLTGMLRCGHCGAPLVASSGSKGRRYYICETHRTPGTVACDGQRTYGARRLEHAVLSQVQHLLTLADPSALRLALRQELTAEQDEAHRHRQTLMLALARVDRILQGWLDRLECLLAGEPGSLSEEVLAERIAAAQVRRDELYRMLSTGAGPETELPGPQSDPAGPESDLPPVTPRASWWTGFAQAPLPEQRLLLRDLLSAVVVRRDVLELRFRVRLHTLLG